MSARDPGLQPERTRLAWSRTALAVAVNAALVIRAGVVAPDRALLVLGVVLGVVSTFVIVAGSARRKGLVRNPPEGPSARLMLLTSGATVLAACCAAATLIR